MKSPYVVVYDKDGVELKRTGLKSGRNPVWDNESFRVAQRLQGLQFIVFDHETLKADDFVGRGFLRFDELVGLPNAVIPGNACHYVVRLNLTYQDSNAGDLILEVSAGNQTTVSTNQLPYQQGMRAQIPQQVPQYGAYRRVDSGLQNSPTLPHRHSGILLTTQPNTPVLQHHYNSQILP